jgi:uncharacterized protein (UPF0332 family)/predicted nucleotidyltransferase
MKAIARPKSRKSQRSGAKAAARPSNRVLFPQARYLTRADRLALKWFLKFLARELPNQVERVILYGSKARGEASSESDLDLLLVTRDNSVLIDPSRALDADNPIATVTMEALSKYGVLLAPLARPQSALRRWSPLFAHIQEEGIELWRRRGVGELPWATWGGADVAKNRNEHISVRMDLAEGKLAQAESLLRDGFYNGVVSASYYAMFYASKAILLSLGEDPHKHKGVVSMFGDKIVKVGLSDPKYGKLLSNAKKLREDADYEDYFRASSEQAKESIQTAKEFLEEARLILERIEQNYKKES